MRPNVGSTTIMSELRQKQERYQSHSRFGGRTAADPIAAMNSIVQKMVLVLLMVFQTGGFLSLAAAAEREDDYQREILPLLRTYCFECHGPSQHKGELRVDQLDPEMKTSEAAETWQDVLDQLKQGEMPPDEARQPSSQERGLITAWLSSALRDASEARRYQDGRVVTRRMTRYEYANTMRDLLQVDLDFSRDLPPDPISPEGFENNAAVLEMSPTQLETYLSVARAALTEAIVNGDRPKLYAYQETQTAVGKLPDREIAGHQPVNPEFVLDLAEFPRRGEFELKVTAVASVPDNQGLPRMEISMGHVPGIVHVPRAHIGTVDVSEKRQTFVFHGRMEDFPQPGSVAFGNSGFKGLIVIIDFVDADGNELRYPDRKYVQEAPAPKKDAKAAGAKKGADSQGGTESQGGTDSQGGADPKEPSTQEEAERTDVGERLDIHIQSVEFSAPVYASWPPPSHGNLLFESQTPYGSVPYAGEVLERLMTSAFRRPVTEMEVAPMVDLFQKVYAQAGSFETAIREAFAAVLISPHFLYIVEQRDEQFRAQPVNHFELASRLSYFLWSTAPDSELMQLASLGTLSQPEVLQAQTMRLLQDPRSQEFVVHFVDQWLDLEALQRVAVNPEFFPNFDISLKEHMRQQTQLFFAEILRHDRSALEFLAADWEMLNRPLAEHYGIAGPRSSQFERVVFGPEDRRGGLLTQGAYLLANSNGEDSHPIKRAVWILDRLLDSPPASPPPDVPALDSTRPDMAKLTLKEQLEIHRQKESCASCHKGIDPWGIPLENYDAIGRWRMEVPANQERAALAVDASSVLPDGTEIQGLVELQDYLVENQGRLLARSIVKRVMSYALARSLDFGDRDTIENLTSRFIENDFRLQPLIVDVVQSEVFQTK